MKIGETKSRMAIFETAANRKMINTLRNAGFDVTCLFAISLDDLFVTETDLPTRLGEFDVLILPEQFSSQLLLNQFRSRNADLFALDDICVCTLSEAVADSLRFEQIHSDIIPQNCSFASVENALLNYFSGQIDGLRIAVYGCEAFAELAKYKSRFGAEVFESFNIPVEFSKKFARQKLLIECGSFDQIVFGTADDILRYKLIFANLAFGEIPNDFEIKTCDGNTFQAAREALLSPRMLIL
ncbi:MAG: hypothetical protein ACK5NT_15660 [Pyrinomonadaceae bacterium]